MEFKPATEDDLATVTTQLGRRPRGVVGIQRRCPAGHPCVISSYPVQHGGDRIVPFPTLYWLTCPELVKSISRLEAAGLIRELDARLDADTALADALRRDHESYIRERWQLLSGADRDAVEAAGLSDMLQQKGIGGIQDFRRVKCLHLHFAHHVAAGNVIGSLLQEEHGIELCR